MAIESILTSVKQNLGITEEYDHFDSDLIMHINSALSILTQVGVGPESGFAIIDKNSKWSDFMGSDKRLNMVQQFVYARVRVAFDPPSNSFTLDALNKIADELVWRIEVAANPPDPIVISTGKGGTSIGDTDGISKGTTPTLYIEVDTDLTEYPKVVLYVEDKRGVELQFDRERLEIAADYVKCKITQEETYKLRTGPLKAQIKAKASDGTVIISNIMVTSIKDTVPEREVW